MRQQAWGTREVEERRGRYEIARACVKSSPARDSSVALERAAETTTRPAIEREGRRLGRLWSFTVGRCAVSRCTVCGGSRFRFVFGPGRRFKARQLGALQQAIDAH